jgi:hypothetical protein
MSIESWDTSSETVDFSPRVTASDSGAWPCDVRAVGEAPCSRRSLVIAV